jgi:ribonuclease R
MNKNEILSLIQASPEPLTNRDIARAFRLKGSGPRVTLKKILRELEDEAHIQKNPGGGWSVADALPAVTTIEVSEISVDGDVFAKPAQWNTHTQGVPPRIEVAADRKTGAVTRGDRVLARLERQQDNTYIAHIIRRIDTPRDRMIGVVHMTKRGAVLQSANKKERDDFEILDAKGAKDGDLVVAELQQGRTFRDKKVRIVEIIGKRGDPKSISLISLYEAGINPKFPDAVIKETNGMSVPSPENREDLCGIPLVTIDGIDAKDFDDAVFAEAADEGFHLIVAIADVAYYVRPDSALDNEAVRRGNSTYFPDRVVPMLPEALSNDLCSLRPNEPRACLAMHMWIDRDGKMIRHKVVRGLMKSAARLTYEQVQHIHDHEHFHEFWPIIRPLYEAFRILDDARRKRGALELDLPERKVILDEKGNMKGVIKRERFDSHKLIEEFMVLANVAAASALEARKAPCVYRIHDAPSPDRLDSAREFLESFNLSLPKGQVIKPAQLNQILLEAGKLPYSHLISTVVLRTQSQAHYSPDNIGHFGLALQRYAHFTSPIRRYADLLVHRSLISAYQLGPGGIDQGEVAKLEEICQQISDTERTSMEAERGAIDRFTAAFLSERIGAEFAGRINGVTRFGLFVELEESGADGLVPIRSLPQDYYIHDERSHALIGRRSGIVFRMGAPVTVRLMEADGLTGSTLLNLIGHDHGADIPGMELKVRKNRHQQRRDQRPGKPRKNRDFRGDSRHKGPGKTHKKRNKHR